MPCHRSTCGLDHCGCGGEGFVVSNIGGLGRDFAVILGTFWRNNWIPCHKNNGQRQSAWHTVAWYRSCWHECKYYHSKQNSNSNGAAHALNMVNGTNKQIKDMQVYWEWKNFQEKVMLECSKWENKWLYVVWIWDCLLIEIKKRLCWKKVLTMNIW